jgi:hypothetical protein
MIHNSTPSQEIPRILWNLKIHYRVPILSYISPVTLFLEGHFNIIFSPTHTSSKWSNSLKFPHKNDHTPHIHACHMPCPSHGYWFVHPNSIWWREHIISPSLYKKNDTLIDWSWNPHQEIEIQLSNWDEIGNEDARQEFSHNNCSYITYRHA